MSISLNLFIQTDNYLGSGIIGHGDATEIDDDGQRIRCPVIGRCFAHGRTKVVHRRKYQTPVQCDQQVFKIFFLFFNNLIGSFIGHFN